MNNTDYNVSKYNYYNDGVFKICALTSFFSSYYFLNNKCILFINIVWLNEILTS